MANLTAQQIKEINRPGKYSDGRGLLLVVSPAGTKSWAQRITVDGKRIDRGLGSFPKVSLSRAREIADRNRAAVKQGRNPWAETRPPNVLTAQPTPAVPTFADAARTVYGLNLDEWGDATATRWIARLERHIFPELGDAPVDAITRAEVAAVIGPLRRSNYETARKVRQAMAKVFRWVRANEYRADDPADDALGELLPKITPQVEHRQALHHSEVKGAIRKIRNSEAKRVTRLMFEFLILTAARTSEVRFAVWGEIDGDTWTIPAGRMKAKRDHVVPLSAQAQAVLRQARELRRNLDDDSEYDWPVEVSPDDYIFPYPGKDKPLSENTLLDRAKKDNLGCVPHGMRSSFRDWAAECSGASWEVIELSLAHAVGTSVSEAYFRSAMLDQRRPMMQAWADYTDPTPPPF